MSHADSKEGISTPRLLERQRPLHESVPDVVIDGLIVDGHDPLAIRRAQNRARVEQAHRFERARAAQQTEQMRATAADVHARKVAEGRAGRVAMERRRQEGR